MNNNLFAERELALLKAIADAIAKGQKLKELVCHYELSLSTCDTQAERAIPYKALVNYFTTHLNESWYRVFKIVDKILIVHYNNHGPEVYVLEKEIE